MEALSVRVMLRRGAVPQQSHLTLEVIHKQV
jgi:hypothetical protein